MAQLTGTAGRSTSHSPAAFVAGTLFAVAAMATIIILALALGVNVELRDDATAANAGAGAPASTYDGRLDPIEDAYIRERTGPGSVARPGVGPYDGRLDPIEQGYIDGVHAGQGAASRPAPQQSAPAGHSSPDIGLPPHRLVPR